MVAEYKVIRETVQRGALYRLITPEHNSQESVTESVARNGKQVVTFAFLHSSAEMYPFPSIHLKSLDENAMYGIKALSSRIAADTPARASGSYWMQHGVNVELRGDFQAAAFTLATE